jgi:hypothetical protein
MAFELRSMSKQEGCCFIAKCKIKNAKFSASIFNF